MKLPKYARLTLACSVFALAGVIASPQVLAHTGHKKDDGLWNEEWQRAAPNIPDVSVTTQDGARLRLRSGLIKGRTVAINFIFTTCTEICLPLSDTFRKVQAELGERMGRDVQLISVTVDPENDTPAVLKRFAQQFDAGPGWTFVTGNKKDIERLLRAFGVPPAGKANHTPIVFVGNDAAKRWTRTYGLAPAASIAAALREAAGPAPRGDAAAQSRAYFADEVGRDASAPASTSPAAVRKSRQPFPDLPLLDQDGRRVRFYSDLVKGRVVLINFIFASCTDVCSPLTANLVKLQKELGERIGRDITMISITVDPENDSPATLKEYAARHEVRPGWLFLTGTKADVDRVSASLGGLVPEKNQHSTLLLVGNEQTDEWTRLFALASPATLASEIRKLAPERRI